MLLHAKEKQTFFSNGGKYMRKMFSEKQIKKMVSESSSEIVEALAGQDLKVKTIEQSEANYSADLTQFVNVTNGTSTLIFGRIQRINGELHIIYIGSIKNETENSITGVYDTSELTVTLPEKIASKIVTYGGHLVSESGNDNETISCTLAYVDSNASGTFTGYLPDMTFCVRKSSSANKIKLRFGRGSSWSINAGSTRYFEGRVSLDLL